MKTTFSLDSDWFFAREGSDGWRPILIPGAWEAAGAPKDDPGPYWLRTTFEVPPLEARQRAWLCFDGVSYACQVSVNGQRAGAHLGMWDAFRVEITPFVRPGERAELLLKVEKPASPTAGYQSPPVPGNYPLRETLAGFLPYVWGHAFGGVWQPVRLEITGRTVIRDVWVKGEADGRVRAAVALSAPGEMELEICDPDGRRVAAETRAAPDGEAAFELQVPAPAAWSPWRPARYTARVRTPDGEAREVRFGLRSLAARGNQILLNGKPVFPRMVLSWGWYPDQIAPNPSAARIRADLERLRALGYNGVKLCLWFPPQVYFDLADELGMLLWVELPVWLPVMNEFFKRQAPDEIAALVRQARNHPAVILYTLGCELNEEADPATVQSLTRLVKNLAGDALVRDNSGSSEAYGGTLDEWAEFYDHHFYADQQFMRPLLDDFAPGWRKPQPWLFGEFCDYDTLRDIPRLQARRPSPPWWEVANPQGARASVDLVDQLARLQESGLWERAGELHRLSVRQGLLHRKLTVELVRSRTDTSGYVITGEVDTPITTAGMWDELGEVKFESGAFRQFNQDTVVVLGWRRRREWVARGDRPIYWDRFCYRAGERVRAHLVVSHFGPEAGETAFEWEAAFPGGGVIAVGAGRGGWIEPGEAREVGLAEFTAPEVARPRRMDFRVRVRVGRKTTENSWRMYVFPADPWAGVGLVFLHDPRGRLAGLPAGLGESGDRAGVGLFTVWDEKLAGWVAAGGRGVLLLERDGMPSPLPKVEVPFWREALKVAHPHSAWGDFPEPDDAQVQFYGLAPDVALDARDLSDEKEWILRRVDTRQIRLLEYAVELKLGAGRLIASTLRVDGGLGDQPSGVAHNPAGMHLLACWVRELQRRA